MPFYALGWKGFVEVRSARRAPTPNHSSIDHSLLKSNGWEQTRIKLKQYCFRGGEHILTLLTPRFIALTGLKVPTGKTLKLSPAHQALIEEERNVQFAPQAPQETSDPSPAPPPRGPNRPTRRASSRPRITQQGLAA